MMTNERELAWEGAETHLAWLIDRSQDGHKVPEALMNEANEEFMAERRALQEEYARQTLGDCL